MNRHIPAQQSAHDPAGPVSPAPPDGQADQADQARRTTGRSTGRAAVIALAALVLAIPTLLQLPPVHDAMADAHVLPRAASFSTLALKEANDLDDTVRPDGRTAFTFVATNEGEETKTYTWTVSVTTGDDAPAVIRGGELELAGGAAAEVPVALRLDHCRRRNVITVTLDGPDERSPSVGYPVLWHGGREWKSAGGPSCG
ncbi:hypothetical protein KIH74_24085 [Kineosporia sp. J2-2]|uniref:Uncharacterized protein n=1 Tax=Kineosporia corallincola TaxID=2835133 RepID=A0ABS5TQN3_9ACTN|nr:hypothetical protein [Kineosporia corallincola]MBT0772044.1 hypothetical protein [Kineosporia corallincola]